MKSAHQEAAHKTEDHTRTKQIWIGAVSTCVLNNQTALYNLFTFLLLGMSSSASQGLFLLSCACSGTQGSNETSFHH